MRLKRTGVVAGVGLLAAALAIPVGAQASAPTAIRPSPAAELASVVQASDAAAANGYTLSARVTSSISADAPSAVNMSWSGPDSNIAWVGLSDTMTNYTIEITDFDTQMVYSRLDAEQRAGNSTVVTDAAYQTVLDVTGLADDSWLSEPVPDWVENPGLASEPFSNLLAGAEDLPGWKRTVNGSTVTYTRGNNRGGSKHTVEVTDSLISRIGYKVSTSPKASRTYWWGVVSLDGPAFEVPDISQLDAVDPELSQAIQDYLKESLTVSIKLKALADSMGRPSLAAAKRILANEFRDSGMTVTWTNNKATVTSPASEAAAAAGFPDACGTLTVLKNKKPVVGAC